MEGKQGPRRRRILKKTNGRCAYCGCPLDGVENWPIDHMIPRAQGGSSKTDNLIAACHRCNREKLDRDVDEFREYIYLTLTVHLGRAYSRLERVGCLMPDEDREEIEQALINLDSLIRSKADQGRVVFYIDQIGNDSEETS